MIEEFGCTNESRQSATDAQGTFHPYRWDLNLLVDRYGNQIRVHYQQDQPIHDVRDSVISFIEYDDPTCHNANYAQSNGVTLGCSSWNPLVKIAFNAEYKADRILNTTGGCNNWSQYIRCDAPADLSGSNGLPAPKAFSDYILNNVQIQSNGHALNEYDFSYDQQPPGTFQDPLSGANESVAGYLLLRKIDEFGTDSTLHAPIVNISYIQETEHYEASDSAHHAQPLGNCGPSWTPRYTTNDCWLWQQTYNKYFIQNLDNGRGWNETINWSEAHGNTHGTDGGAANNALTCNPSRSSTNLCGQADDRSWSRMVVYSRTAVTNGVSSTWQYQYYVNSLSATWCPNCTYGYTWGNVNDEDYADYYNEQFTSFSTVDVTQPDGSSQQHSFYSTSGPGIATSGITCYYKYNNVANCGVSPYYPNDNPLGSVYLTNLPALTTTQSASGTQYGCHATFYGGNSAFNTAPSLPNVTRTEDHTGYSDPSNGCNAPGSMVVNQATFDASGTPVATLDPDSHKGCTNGSSQYTACASYDGFGTHLTKAYNAKNQMVQADYNSTAAGGYGQWLMATKDANGQSTAYQYDVLGRLTAVAAPGDTLDSPTITYAYKNTCTQGSTAPCLELDTTTRQISGGTQTVTTQQWYDGQGRLIETKAPGPNLWSKVPKISSTLITYTVYDTMGRATTKSLPYAISSLSGTGYIAPNLAQARTVTTYDGLGRPLGSATYQDATTIKLSTSVAYTVGVGLPSFTQSTTLPFERTTTLDAYNHQSVSYADGVGYQRYTQVFSGTGPSYAVVRTIRYDRDIVGNLYATLTYDATTTLQASQNATYDGVGRKVGMSDSDSGNNWVYNYDGDSNLLSQTDPRGQSTYVSYDQLNRPLCKGTTSASVNPCSSSAYATFFYDSYDNSSNTGVSFPSGCTAPTGSFASDPIGKETADTFRATAGSGWRCSGYDERGRPDQNSLSVTADGTTTTQTVNASYNDANQLTTLNYPDGELVTSQYDSNDYLRSTYFGGAGVTNPVTFLVGQVSYTNAGQLSGLAFGGSAVPTGVPTPVFSTSLSYDGIQRPLTSTASRSGTTFWSQTRTYDNVGNVINLSTTVPTTTNGTKTDSQSFCYDDLNRLVWSGNTGTPTGGNHCGLAPNGTTVGTYQQSYSYDALDRLTNGPSGSETYGTFPAHGVVTLGNVPNQYASYDAMGDMTCRNVDTTSGHSCDAAQSGAIMTYDNEGRLATWVAPNGTVASDQYLYDNSGQRVLQRASNTVGSTTTTSDTISFDGFTDVTITGSTTSTTKYYSVGGQIVAMRQDGTFSYLMPDFLGSNSIALRSDGSVQAVQLFLPFGSNRYSDGTMLSPFNFTGQRLDTQTGLLYYGARYYDTQSGRFISADTVETNLSGLDTYTYVRGNPETAIDPSGHSLWDGNDAGGSGGVIEPGSTDNGGDSGSGSSSGETGGSNWWDSITNWWNSWFEGDGGSSSAANGGGNSIGAFGDFGSSGGSPEGESGAGSLIGDAGATGVVDGSGNSTDGNSGSNGSGSTPTNSGTETNPTRMNPNNIGFTQDTVPNSGRIKGENGGAYTVKGNIAALKSGNLTPDDLPAIRVFNVTNEIYNSGDITGGPGNKFTGNGQNLLLGQWYTLDNRRLFAFQRAGITDIPVTIWKDTQDILNEGWKFTTTKWGIDATLK
ncbi:RHS repeat-associated core domain-containing protein [Dictyobacter kobayashii]|nr:RHS repeat-associated core domain-containing protein [Dictyobacter kobayashii]